MAKGMKKLSPPALAVGPNTAFLQGVPEGEVHGLDVEFAGTGKSTGAAFNFSNPQGITKKARSADDLDKMLAFIFTSLSFSIDGTHKNLDAFDVTKWRSLLSFVLGIDFEASGLCIDGTQVPVSTDPAADLGFGFYLPISLVGAFEDGDQWVQGSARVQGGYVKCKVSALAGNIGLGGGTMTLAALTWTIHAQVDDAGDPGTVGNDWTAEDLAGQQSDNPPLARAVYTHIIDDASDYAGTYTTKNPVELEQIDRNAIVRAFNKEWNPAPDLAGRDNSCSRGTPLGYPTKGIPFHLLKLVPFAPKLKNDSGDTQNFLVFKVKPAGEATSAAGTVATKVGGGGPTHAIAKPVRSAPSGQVPPHLARWVARTVRKGTAPASRAVMARR